MILENAGPPANRINYIIVGDGYTTAELDTTYRAHLENMLDYVYGFHCDEHRHAYPDPMKMRAGFEVLLECLEFPSAETRRRAEQYFNEETASIVRRQIKHQCLDTLVMGL
jgi:hypothetical protein